MPGKQNEAPVKIQAEQITELSCKEICAICHVDPEFIQELISYGTIEPRGFSIETWRFSTEDLRVVHTAVRLHQDLEVNHPGIALAIDLMSEVEDLRQRLDRLEKFFKISQTL